MVNPNPSPSTRFQRGQERAPGSGRRLGQLGPMAQIVGLLVSDAAKEAAEQLGFVREVEVVTVEGGTPKTELQYTGEDGMVGYMKWLGLYHPASFAAILGRSQPRELNARVQHSYQQDVPYRTAEEVEAEMKQVGLNDKVIDLVLEDLRK
jgi:hypothetical protein